jgi:ferredoxin
MVGPEAFTEVRFLAAERMRQALQLIPAVEARRCMSCGNCFGACPDNAVIKTGPGG